METITQSQPSPERVATAALQAFFGLTERWGLSVTEQRTLLGEPSSSTFYRWKADQQATRLNRDTLDRISYLLGIHKALSILLPEDRALTWIKRPNSAQLFGGRTALDHMLGGSVTDLADVRRYLDAERG